VSTPISFCPAIANSADRKLTSRFFGSTLVKTKSARLVKSVLATTVLAAYTPLFPYYAYPTFAIFLILCMMQNIEKFGQNRLAAAR
jgi:hypothetical protein